MDVKQQIALMDRYNEKYKNTFDVNKSQRELICLRELYPLMFIEPEIDDYYVGKKKDIPVYFGLNNSSETKDYIGYIFDNAKMSKCYNGISSKSFKNKLNQIKEYWQKNDFYNTFLASKYNSFRKGIEIIPSIESLNFDFNILLRKGVLGIRKYLESINTNDFIDSSLQCMFLLEYVIDYYISILRRGNYTHKDLMINTLSNLKKYPPKSLHESAQLIYLYKQISGVENYNEIKDYLSNYVNESVDEDSELRSYFYEFISLMDYKSHLGNIDPKIKLSIKFDCSKLFKNFKIESKKTKKDIIIILDKIITDTKNNMKQVYDFIKSNYSYNYTSILNQESLDKKASIVELIPVVYELVNKSEFIDEASTLICEGLEISRDEVVSLFEEKLNTLEE